MTTPLLTIQYLEDSPTLPTLDPSRLVTRLRAAAECLPISHLLIGWHLPHPVLEACYKEAERLGVCFMRWQPLLTTDKAYPSDPDWRVEDLAGQKAHGFHALPEFTFYCPNHPAVQEAVVSNLQSQIHRGIFQGFFLDRVRFPSPSNDPIVDLACFCEHCCRRAAETGIDLPHIRRLVVQDVTGEGGAMALVKSLLTWAPTPPETELDHALYQLLSFRRASIRDFVELACQPLREAHMEIGLDCFSPCLTSMVGQDLSAMSQYVDWIKLMTYAHTFGPAGLPFELAGLIRFLVNHTALEEVQIMHMLCGLTGLPLPRSRQALEVEGLASSALEEEIRRGTKAVNIPILAGIELVDLPGVTHLTLAQIQSDLAAIKRSAAQGLAISWDLLHISQEKLELVAKAYFGRV
jgi:hypothetical protein